MNDGVNPVANGRNSPTVGTTGEKRGWQRWSAVEPVALESFRVILWPPRCSAEVAGPPRGRRTAATTGSACCREEDERLVNDERGTEEQRTHPVERPYTRHLGPYHRAVIRDDAEIRKDISNSLALDTAVDASHIGVDVSGGIVTLTGTVSSIREKGAAEDDAWSIPGVLNVHNNLKVQTSEPRG